MHTDLHVTLRDSEPLQRRSHVVQFWTMDEPRLQARCIWIVRIVCGPPIMKPAIRSIVSNQDTCLTSLQDHRTNPIVTGIIRKRWDQKNKAILNNRRLRITFRISPVIGQPESTVIDPIHTTWELPWRALIGNDLIYWLSLRRRRGHRPDKSSISNSKTKLMKAQCSSRLKSSSTPPLLS